MGFVFSKDEGGLLLHTTDDWYEDFAEVYETVNAQDSVNEDEMQIDCRQEIVMD
jgi:hypothetical protein